MYKIGDYIKAVVTENSNIEIFFKLLKNIMYYYTI